MLCALTLDFTSSDAQKTAVPLTVTRPFFKTESIPIDSHVKMSNFKALKRQVLLTILASEILSTKWNSTHFVGSMFHMHLCSFLKRCYRPQDNFFWHWKQWMLRVFPYLASNPMSSSLSASSRTSTSRLLTELAKSRPSDFLLNISSRRPGVAITMFALRHRCTNSRGLDVLIWFCDG